MEAELAKAKPASWGRATVPRVMELYSISESNEAWVEWGELEGSAHVLDHSDGSVATAAWTRLIGVGVRCVDDRVEEMKHRHHR